MKITKASARGTVGSHRTPGRWPPAWLIEWKENQGRYVELACGHIVDLNDRSVAVLIHPREKMIDCEIHRAWQKIAGKATFHEFAGIKVQPIPDEPLF